MLKDSIRGSSLFPQLNVKQTYCEDTNGDVKLESIVVNLTGSLDNMLNLRKFYQLNLFSLKTKRKLPPFPPNIRINGIRP